jgi:hypothetical protein
MRQPPLQPITRPTPSTTTSPNPTGAKTRHPPYPTYDALPQNVQSGSSCGRAVPGTRMLCGRAVPGIRGSLGGGMAVPGTEGSLGSGKAVPGTGGLLCGIRGFCTSSLLFALLRRPPPTAPHDAPPVTSLTCPPDQEGDHHKKQQGSNEHRAIFTGHGATTTLNPPSQGPKYGDA